MVATKQKTEGVRGARPWAAETMILKVLEGRHSSRQGRRAMSTLKCDKKDATQDSQSQTNNHTKVITVDRPKQDEERSVSFASMPSKAAPTPQRGTRASRACNIPCPRSHFGERRQQQAA